MMYAVKYCDKKAVLHASPITTNLTTFDSRLKRNLLKHRVFTCAGYAA